MEKEREGTIRSSYHPPGISRQWPFPALTNSLRDSTETISTIARAHTTLRVLTGVLSRTRISSTDFLLFSFSLPLFSSSLSSAVSPRPFAAFDETLSPASKPLALPLLVDDDFATTSKKVKEDEEEEEEERFSRALHATHPHTTRTTSSCSSSSSLFQHVYRISALPRCRLHHTLHLHCMAVRGL